MIVQRSARPQDLDAAEADLLVMAEQSKQKYLDIVGRLQKESLKSESAYVDESVEDHEEENTIEDEYDDDENIEGMEEPESDSLFKEIPFNPNKRPDRGCLTKFRKVYPSRPLSPSGVGACFLLLQWLS